ncbi:MAG: hypothetical protein ACRDRI_04290 [Pseudonocardiaceae bacterium]
MIHRMTCIAGHAAGSGAYYCGWAITGRGAVAHLVAAADFPLVGSRHRSWCGKMITVIGLTLDSRSLPRSCARCNRRLRAMALTQRLG